MTDPTRISDDQHNNAPAVPEGWRDFLTELSKQKPEKPDYWSSCGQCERNSSTAEDLIAATPAPAPAQGDPFGYFRAEPFGWTDCSEDAEGAIALYEHPAKPAQDVGLTDDGIAALWRYFADSNQVIRIEQDRFANLVRTIEKLIPATRISDRQFDLICQAIDKADTITMEGDYMLDSDDCIGVVRVMQVLFDIAAIRAKGAV